MTLCREVKLGNLEWTSSRAETSIDVLPTRPLQQASLHFPDYQVCWWGLWRGLGTSDMGHLMHGLITPWMTLAIDKQWGRRTKVQYSPTPRCYSASRSSGFPSTYLPLLRQNPACPGNHWSRADSARLGWQRRCRMLPSIASSNHRANPSMAWRIILINSCKLILDD